MTIGEKIKSFRNIRRISQKTLAELSGVSEGAIRKYEAGTGNPKSAQLKKLAQALELDDTAFLDFKFELLNIETVGDALALYFVLEKYIGSTYLATPNKDTSNITSPKPLF
jgi:transcriptional regulator with XRE-family HTH domain